MYRRRSVPEVAWIAQRPRPVNRGRLLSVACVTVGVPSGCCLSVLLSTASPDPEDLGTRNADLSGLILRGVTDVTPADHLSARCTGLTRGPQLTHLSHNVLVCDALYLLRSTIRHIAARRKRSVSAPNSARFAVPRKAPRPACPDVANSGTPWGKWAPMRLSRPDRDLGLSRRTEAKAWASGRPAWGRCRPRTRWWFGVVGPHRADVRSAAHHEDAPMPCPADLHDGGRALPRSRGSARLLRAVSPPAGGRTRAVRRRPAHCVGPEALSVRLAGIRIRDRSPIDALIRPVPPTRTVRRTRRHGGAVALVMLVVRHP